MNYKTTFGLLALFIVAVVCLRFVVSTGNPTTREIEQLLQQNSGSGTPVFASLDNPLTPESVTGLTVETDGQTVEIGKVDGEWAQTAPVAFPLNNWAVDGLVRDALTMSSVETFQPGRGKNPGLGDVKLDPANATLTLHFGEDDDPVTVHVGRTATGGRGYVYVNDEPSKVYVVDNAVHEAVLNKGINDWRKKSFTAPRAGSIGTITLAYPDQTVSMVSTPTGWAFAGELTGRVDKAAADGMVTGFNTIYISKFYSDQADAEASVFGLNDPQVVVTLQPKAEANATPESTPASPRVLTIGSPVDAKADQYFATLSTDGQPAKVVFGVSASVYEKYSKPIAELRDKRLTVLAAGEVVKLTLTRPDLDTPVTLSKSDAGWTFAEGAPAYEADAAAVAAMVTSLAEAKADAVEVDVPTGDPAATVAMFKVGMTEPETLRFYPGDDAVRVVRNNEPVAQVIGFEAEAMTVLDPLYTMRAKKVVDADRDQITRVVVKAPGTSALTLTRGDDEAKSLSLEGHEVFETSSARALVGELAQMAAEAWLDPQTEVDATHEITFSVADNVRTLAFNADSRAATMETVDQPFVLPQLAVDRLVAELRDRTALELPRASIKSVTVDPAGADPVTITYDGETYAAEGIELDNASAAGYFDVLSKLEVKRYLDAMPRIAPTRTFTARTEDAEHSLQVFATDSRTIAQVAGKSFELTEADAKKLMASPTGE